MGNSADPFLGTHWYANTRGAFHLEAKDWVRSGKGACGADIRNPAFTVTSPTHSGQRLCQRCVSKLHAEVK